METDLTKDAVEIFNAAVESVRPERLIPQRVRRKGDVLSIEHLDLNLRSFSKIVVVGGGKASAAMAAPMEKLLDPFLSGGIIVTKYTHGIQLNKVRVHEAGHPVPDERGVEGTMELLRTVESLGEGDLVFCLLSGGGSALLSSFENAITLEDVQVISRLLLSSGTPIEEVNAVRKHISRVGGGKLARLAYPATVVTLVLSDVIGDPLDSIASGPTVPDPTSFGDVERILACYSLNEKLPSSIRNFVNEGRAGKVAETPKPGDRVFVGSRTFLIGNNQIALDAARARAESLGYDAEVLSTQVHGESREVARTFARRAKELQKKRTDRRAPICLLMGGETTVTIHGSGRGGRNQEFALSASLEVERTEGVAILSGGTDGTDGLTEVAGAVVDGSTCVRARQANVVPEEYLENNDSYNFFCRVGGHLETGPTLTNVMDIMIALAA